MVLVLNCAVRWSPPLEALGLFINSLWFHDVRLLHVSFMGNFGDEVLWNARAVVYVV